MSKLYSRQCLTAPLIYVTMLMYASTNYYREMDSPCIVSTPIGQFVKTPLRRSVHSLRSFKHVWLSK